MLRYIMCAATVVAALLPAAAAVTGDSVGGNESAEPALMERVARSGEATPRLMSLSLDNPAVMPLWRDYSISEVKVGFNSRTENEAVDVMQGNKDRTVLFDAATYMKHRNSTLWGEAYYNNGRIRGINWNETSEPLTVYPYLLADSVGGKMNVERYSFMGGWAGYDGRLAWGAKVGYTAGLYYRNVDPRPRNISATLDVSAGVGYTLWRDYVLAASVNYRKYKQTNNVAFYSELGNDKLFHLIGFANDYSRFAGTGIQTYYNGHRLGGSLNLHPAGGKGFAAAVNASRFAFDNIITQLNKLPMARVTHNLLQARAGWLAPASFIGHSWGVAVDVMASRRVGSENVFGDPAASVYTCIGTLDMYFENRFGAGVDAVWESRWGTVDRFVGVMVHPQVQYRHVNEIYVDPASRRYINEMAYDLRLKFVAHPNRRTLLALTLGATREAPTSSLLEVNTDAVKSELAGLERALERNFAYCSSRRTSCLAGFNATVAINEKFALHCGVEWSRTALVLDTHRNNLQLSLGVDF